jgi:hypothetical protein
LAKDFLDHRPREDGGGDLDPPGGPVRAVRHVDVEDALEQPSPADALRPTQGGLDFPIGVGRSVGRCLCLRERALRHHHRPQLGVRCQNAVEPD